MENHNNEYFVKEQYKNSDNLNARINLHTFNINKTDWNVWFFNNMNIPENAKILELGCGNGLLWKKNENMIKENWNMVLSDLSQGMLQSAKQNLNFKNIKYQIIDIQDIPYDDEVFDIVIARHMLYHVPDIDKALSEVRRVLKPAGKLYVSTNGKAHMQELAALVKSYDKNIKYNLQKLPEIFGLENGGEMLRKYFKNISTEEFNGQIVIDKAEPVVAYVTSSNVVRELLMSQNKLDSFYKYVEAEINRSGAIKITTNTGMFTASNS